MTEFWRQWEGEVVNGVFPLRRLLKDSDHSAVFLTDCTAQNLSDAAIKIVPADPLSAEVQLSLWRAAAALPHPHLIRLLDSGRCQLGGHAFLFVVMEYAEETLSQILPQRALTADEVREMLIPTLDALAFLHGKNLVQGQLKPPNVLVVGDQLKLASDTIRPAGKSAAQSARLSVYDPPEAGSGTISAAGDIWSLGVTTVEALTQRPPAWQDERLSLPTTLPHALADAIRRCLSPNPADRPAAPDLAALLKPPPAVAAASAAPQGRVREAPARAAAPRASPKQRVPVLAIALGLVILIAAWASLRFFLSHPNSQQSAPGSQTSSQQADTASAAASRIAQPAPPETSATSSGAKSTRSKPALSRAASSSRNPADASSAVVHEEIPVVPRSASETIHGHLKVTVLVNVDRSGNVVDASLENPGPSGYFARLAKEAARKWKFVPANNQDARKWSLTFEFTRSGTTGRVGGSGP